LTLEFRQSIFWSEFMATKGSRKPGSGRNKNSFSFATLTIKDLLAKFADHETTVIVGRKWAEQVGFTKLQSTSANKIIGRIEGTTPETAVQGQTIDFNA
jgi:hypothetical protein